MSGHSKWHSIRHKKGIADSKRAQKFTKLANAIAIAAREGGGDPGTNFSLRLAIDAAKSANMPKDNIERAIQRGIGVGAGGQLDTVVYEGMGPGGVAVIVEAVTDNKNRTVANVKTLFNKYGGNMEAKILWLFDRKGVVEAIAPEGVQRDEVELQLIDAGVDDIQWEGTDVIVVCEVSRLQSVEHAMKSAGLDVKSAELRYLPKDYIEVSDEDKEKVKVFIDALEEDDDVSNIFMNTQL